MSEPEIVETWSTVELPILRAIVSAQQSGQGRIWEAAQLALPDLDRRRVQMALFWLYDGGYITATAASNRWSIEVTGAKPKGLRAVGAWPTADSELTRLTALLDEQIARAEGETKSRLERFRDALLGMGQGAATSLLATYVGRYLPPP